MKVAPNAVFLFRDSEGFATAISEAFYPDPNNPSSLCLTQAHLSFTQFTLFFCVFFSSVFDWIGIDFCDREEPFELSLERYGIKDVKASGNILHFVDHQGLYQVSFLLVQNYEPPILACVITEILEQIAGEKSSPLPTIIVPFIVPLSKLKKDGKTLTKSENKFPIYGVQIGPVTETTTAMAARAEKPSCSFQVHHEPLACLLQLARVSNLPTFVLIVEKGQRISDKNIEGVEILNEIGEILSRTLNLCFSKDRVKWNPKGISKNSKEPWRALYG